MITNTPGCILSISSFEEFQNRLSFLTQSSSGVITAISHPRARSASFTKLKHSVYTPSGERLVITGVTDLFLVLMFYPVEIFDVNIDWNPPSIHLNLSVFTGQKV